MSVSRMTRVGPAPDALTLHLTVKKSEYPELIEWIWRRPYAAQKPMRDALAKSLANGTLQDVPDESA